MKKSSIKEPLFKFVHSHACWNQGFCRLVMGKQILLSSRHLSLFLKVCCLFMCFLRPDNALFNNWNPEGYVHLSWQSHPFSSHFSLQLCKRCLAKLFICASVTVYEFHMRLLVNQRRDLTQVTDATYFSPQPLRNQGAPLQKDVWATAPMDCFLWAQEDSELCGHVHSSSTIRISSPLGK